MTAGVMASVEQLEKTLKVVNKTVDTIDKKGLRPDYVKDVKKMSYLNTYLKAIIRNPGVELMKYYARVSKGYNKTREKILAKIEKK